MVTRTFTATFSKYNSFLRRLCKITGPAYSRFESGKHEKTPVGFHMDRISLLVYLEHPNPPGRTRSGTTMTELTFEP